MSPPQDFESCASANSATSAHNDIYYTILFILCQPVFKKIPLLIFFTRTFRIFRFLPFMRLFHRRRRFQKVSITRYCIFIALIYNRVVKSNVDMIPFTADFNHIPAVTDTLTAADYKLARNLQFFHNHLKGMGVAVANGNFFNQRSLCRVGNMWNRTRLITVIIVLYIPYQPVMDCYYYLITVHIHF